MMGPSEVDPTNMMTGIENVGPGWHPLVRALEAELLKIDPDYQLFQIKEKFGGLRYYVGTVTGQSQVSEQFRALIRDVETASLMICETCGTTDEVTTEGTWIRTLCTACRVDAAARRRAFLENVAKSDG